MSSGWIALLFAAVVAVGAVVSPSARTAETGGWIIVLGTALGTETACQVDLASLANIVPSRTRLRCLRVEASK